ncbi:hypothetical protein PHJA_002000300 [Phtheirospermum japonicum]|uniref:Late embryogenesis abundant protein n=1 Tax=Phtheirospermum japonicum TaxID=374723 RepID=A0A830CR49_9LAMI|nr:hypothetical protein PHJA_002000300 [Phtheirospermum japonicum]
MLHRSSIHLHKLFFKHQFRRFSLLKSPFLVKSSPNFTNPNSQNFYNQTSTNSPRDFKIFQHFRQYSVETDKEVDQINLKFAEAREEIESAMDSKETVYFNEEAECARAVVNEVLEMYEALLRKLPESEKAAIQRAMGLKIEQLKAELQQLNE